MDKLNNLNDLNRYFAESLTRVLEETSTNMGNAMVLDHLANKGVVTLEEAEFYHNLCTDVITEAAEDFIPETLDVPEPEVSEVPAGEGEIFYDKTGNAFIFSGGQMTPVDESELEGDATIDGEVAPEVEEKSEETPEAEKAAPEVEEKSEESEEAPKKAPEVEEKSEEAEEAPTQFAEGETVDTLEAEILEESDNVVARILANLR